MTDHADPIPHYPTLADLDPEDVTTEALVERVRRHRAGEPYPTPEPLLTNLPDVLRALSDPVLTGQASALDIADRVASIFDATAGGRLPPERSFRPH